MSGKTTRPQWRTLGGDSGHPVRDFPRLRRHALALALGTLVAAPALAVDVSLAGVTWTATGNAGVVHALYDDPLNETPDALLGSAVGSTWLGYVSTYHEVVDFNGGYLNPSPLNLVPTEDKEGFTYSQTNGSMAQSSTFSMGAGDRLVMQFNYVSTDGRDYEDYAWARLVNAATQRTAAWLFTARSGNKPDNDGTSDYVQGGVLKDQVGFQDLDSKDPDRQLAVVLPTVPGIMGNTYWAPLGPSSGQCWEEGTSCGYTGWVVSDFTAPTKDFATGSYFLQVGVSNWGDAALQSGIAFDYAGFTPEAFVNPLNVYDPAAAVPEPATWAMLVTGALLLGWRSRQRR